jgi:hypothetical protein
MIMDECGVHGMGKMIDMAEPAQIDNLKKKIQPHLGTLDEHRRGKRIVDKLRI